MVRAKKGFTLLEVIVSTILLSLIMGALASLYFGAKRWVLHARMRMQATEVSTSYLDPLQGSVRQDMWNPASNCLASNGGAGCNTAVDNIEGIAYTPTYIISDAPATVGGINKKVTLTITWNEPTP